MVRTGEERRQGNHNDAAYLGGESKTEAKRRTDDDSGSEGGTWRVLQLVDKHQEQQGR